MQIKGMLHNFHFKIVHRPTSKHFNVDSLNKNPMFVYEDNEDFQVEIPNHIMSSSNSAMEKEVKFVTNNIKFPKIPNFFTLSKVTNDMLLETTRETNSIIQSRELILGRMNSKLPFVCVKSKFTTIDYEQMVMEVQHINKEKGTNLVKLDIDSNQEITHKYWTSRWMSIALSC
jgi:hypothetical protein